MCKWGGLGYWFHNTLRDCVGFMLNIKFMRKIQITVVWIIGYLLLPTSLKECTKAVHNIIKNLSSFHSALLSMLAFTIQLTVLRWLLQFEIWHSSTTACKGRQEEDKIKEFPMTLYVSSFPEERLFFQEAPKKTFPCILLPKAESPDHL